MTVAITRSPAAFQRPFCDATTASQSVANTTNTTADLPATATVDNGLATTAQAILDGTNNRVYLRRVGVWHISAKTAWAANGFGKRLIRLEVTRPSAALTATQNTNDAFTGFFGATHTVDALVYTASTESYVQAILYQSSGGALSTTTTVRAVWLGTHL